MGQVLHGSTPSLPSGGRSPALGAEAVPRNKSGAGSERYKIAMSGRRPRIKCLFSAMRRSWVRSCLRPVAAVHWPLALMVSADPLT